MEVNTVEIERRRKALSLTMEESAALASFPGKQAWYAVEAGQKKNPSVRTMVSIAIALRCTVEELMIIPRAATKAKGKVR